MGMIVLNNVLPKYTQKIYELHVFICVYTYVHVYICMCVCVCIYINLNDVKYIRYCFYNSPYRLSLFFYNTKL